MQTIHKYNLSGHVADHLMPKGAKVLSVQWQESAGGACLWALVDTGQQPELRRFITYGTGHHLTHGEPLAFVSTYQTGPYVFHVFEYRV